MTVASTAMAARPPARPPIWALVKGRSAAAPLAVVGEEENVLVAAGVAVEEDTDEGAVGDPVEAGVVVDVLDVKVPVRVGVAVGLARTIEPDPTISVAISVAWVSGAALGWLSHMA